MMAAILFLSLALGSAGANAETRDLPTDLIPQADLSSGILSSRATLGLREIPTYRGGVTGLIHNTVAVMTENGFGAGVVLSEQAAVALLRQIPEEIVKEYTLVVTNFHVVEEGVAPMVAFAPMGAMNIENSELAQAAIISVVPNKDLALLTVEAAPEHVTGVSLATPGSISVGDDVEAVGHPDGELWTYTRGYVSQLRQGYSWSYNASFELTADVIQTQTPISTGNSGGPLYSREGTLLGINSFSNQGGQNLNFSVSSTEIKELSDALQTSLEIRSVSESITYESLPELLEGAYTLEEEGESDGYLYQLFTLRADGETAVVAIYEGIDSSPVLAYDQQLDDGAVRIYLTPEHDNPGAYFSVEIVDADGDTVATGWDFNGDFVVDYIL